MRVFGNIDRSTVSHSLRAVARHSGSSSSARLGFRPAGLDDPVPALGHAHEHHAAVPVDAEVDAAGRELRPDLHALLAVPAGEVEPVLHAPAGGEPRPRERDATLAAARGEAVHPDFGVGAQEIGHELDEPAAARRQHVEQHVELDVVGVARRHLAPAAVLVEERRREPPRARGHRGVEDGRHLAALLGRGGTLPGVVAHHDEAQRRMAHERGDVDPGADARRWHRGSPRSRATSTARGG